MKINFNQPYLTGKEIEYIQNVIEISKFGGNNYYTKASQKLIEERFNVNKVLLTNSCTAALEISALLLNLDGDDEVIIPSYTFCSTASAFQRAGAKIVFAEISEHDLMIDTNDLKNKITKKTKAIVPVHYGGSIAQIEKIKNLISGTNIKIIEDAAQGFGTFTKNQEALGSIGSYGCISFHETKNIHCGLGGALYINDKDPENLEKTIQIWERGTNRQNKLAGLVDKYTWTELGSSFYLSELQAAFLLAQLETIDKNLSTRKHIYENYINFLEDLEKKNFIRIYKHSNSYKHNHHALIIMVNNETINSELRGYLLSRNIETFIGYSPLHSSPMGKRIGYKPHDLSTTEEISKKLIRLPFHTNLTEENIEYICASIKEYFLRKNER